MKEFDDETTALLETLVDRRFLWGDQPVVVLWIFHVGKDGAAARAWVAEHPLSRVVVSMVSPEKSGLAKWKVSSAKSNLLVLGGRDRKIKGSWTDVKAGEVKDLGKKLLLASKPKP